jgi:hypothetical protein
MPIHYANVQLIDVDSTGQIINKATARMDKYLSATEKQFRVIPNSNIPNSTGYPTIISYLQAEMNDGYYLRHLDNYIIITATAEVVNIGTIPNININSIQAIDINSTPIIETTEVPFNDIDTWIFRLPNNNITYPLNSKFELEGTDFDPENELGSLASYLHGYFITDADREIESVMVINPPYRLYPAIIDPNIGPEDIENMVENTEIIKVGVPDRCAITLKPGDSFKFDVSLLSMVAIRNPNTGTSHYDFIDVEIVIASREEE